MSHDMRVVAVHGLKKIVLCLQLPLQQPVTGPGDLGMATTLKFHGPVTGGANNQRFRDMT